MLVVIRAALLWGMGQNLIRFARKIAGIKFNRKMKMIKDLLHRVLHFLRFVRVRRDLFGRLYCVKCGMIWCHNKKRWFHEGKNEK